MRTGTTAKRRDAGWGIVVLRAAALGCGLLCAPAAAAGTPASAQVVVLGLGRDDAAKYNAEFLRYDPAVALYRERGIQASLVEARTLFGALSGRELTAEQIYAALKPYHVVAFATSHEGVFKLDEAWRRRAGAVSQALARYVREGGGLLVQPQPVRYPGSDDELYWNLVFEPFGMTVLHEGLFDATRAFEGQALYPATFWRTRNIRPHPVTEGVAGLCLPLHDFFAGPGVVAMRYSPDWEVVARGEKEAGSYRSGADNRLKLELAGTYRESPPVVAVRAFGKGRVACYPLAALFTGMNYGNALWPHIVESRGDAAAGHPGDSMKLMGNACRWLAEPALANPELGTCRPEPYQPVVARPSVNLSEPALALTPAQLDAARGVRVVMGAHSSYTDGQGTVAQYAAAAKAAGLAGIVFADPLERLTPETFARLKADCAEASQGGDFYACPGIEFTEGAGNRWFFWGEKLVWPSATLASGTFTHVQWDGRRVNHYGHYNDACGLPGSALLDYRQLRANGSHPENLWWFWHYAPLVYDRGELVADNYGEYLFGLRDLRAASLVSFTRIRAPAEVAAAAALCFTGFRDLAHVRAGLNTRGQGGKGQFVSQGPRVNAWRAVNAQMDDPWRQTRGVQRVRLYFAVSADAGIAEVRVRDADRGLVRRFAGQGAPRLEREFELVHDQQHYLTLEVVDTAGRRAFADDIRLFCYKSGLFRCGDNLNILGPTALCWHPDRNQFFNAAKDFRNGSDYALRGWDTSLAGLGVPTPSALLWDMITIKEAGGEYPHGSREHAVSGRLMDVGINNYDIQIATMRMSRLSEPFDDAKRPTPAMASVARDVGDLAYYERDHTLYAPMERVDMFVAWNHRRDKESRKNYRGALLWHEGEYRFKKDVTLMGAVPIPLIRDTCPTDPAKNVGTAFVVTDAGGATRLALARDGQKARRLQGRIRPGGYAAYLSTPVGYHGLLVPADMDFGYAAHLPGQRGMLAGLGRDGQVIKAGTVLKYRFGVGTFADDEPGNDLLEHTVQALNLDGGQAGYAAEMQVGEVKDAVFFFTVAARGNEAAFTLGPQQLIIDLPIRVQGLADNGCAAVHSSACPRFRFIPVDGAGTAWLTEPIDLKNKMWVGNVFVSDSPAVRLTLVVEGQAEGAPPLLEVHNPTGQAIVTTLSSPAHAPLFGGLTAGITVPAGDSVWLAVRGGKLVPRE